MRMGRRLTQRDWSPRSGTSNPGSGSPAARMPSFLSDACPNASDRREFRKPSESADPGDRSCRAAAFLNMADKKGSIAAGQKGVSLASPDWPKGQVRPGWVGSDVFGNG